ncbi:MAG: thioesterase family protein [Bacteroidales bacterium]|jgi:predicted thioesterase|nr:thioesterase family protein [Bacteroidales bacterium]MBO7323500.1 thioesterase family protein [Bacteroidales bacterium]MBR4974781.1 thioesterase family protein [Bacteroidales bacterium]
MKIGDKGTVTVKVTKENCASAIGSGALDVFATPSMIALMENAACEAIKASLQPGESSVGTKVNISHLKASALEDTITATATLTEIDGRRLVFEVVANDSKGIIGEGTHERFVINVEKFLSKLK